MATSRKRIKVQTANVQLHRNGLTLDMNGVPADQVESVAAHLLDAMRGLTKRGYAELIVDSGSLHGGVFGETGDAPPVAESKRIGFLRPQG
jgi:hypothetical protein